MSITEPDIINITIYQEDKCENSVNGICTNSENKCNGKYLITNEDICPCLINGICRQTNMNWKCNGIDIKNENNCSMSPRITQEE